MRIGTAYPDFVVACLAMVPARLWFVPGILFLGCAPRSVAPPPLLQLRNGDMEQGTDAPTAWGDPWAGYKRRALSRDTTVKHSGQAALKFRLAGISGERTIEQLVRGGAGRELMLRGWVKTDGALQVQVGILPYDQRVRPLTLLSALRLKKTSDWCLFTQKVTLPEGSSGFSVVLRAHGMGTVWLDDVKLSGERVETAPADPIMVSPPEHQEPELPYPGPPGGGWLSGQRTLKEEAWGTEPPVVFLGDSLTWGWQQEGHDAWERHFKPLRALNLGLGGDRTSQILWRIQDGALAGLHPKLVVLGVGINNLIRDTYPPERVVEGIKTCVRAIKRACPGTRVMVVGIFPVLDSPTRPLRAPIRCVNALLARHLPDFLDLGNVFLEPDGNLNPSLFRDGIHLTAQGYTLYCQKLSPRILSLLKP